MWSIKQAYQKRVATSSNITSGALRSRTCLLQSPNFIRGSMSPWWSFVTVTNTCGNAGCRKWFFDMPVWYFTFWVPVFIIVADSNKCFKYYTIEHPSLHPPMPQCEAIWYRYTRDTFFFYNQNCYYYFFFHKKNVYSNFYNTSDA